MWWLWERVQDINGFFIIYYGGIQTSTSEHDLRSKTCWKKKTWPSLQRVTWPVTLIYLHLISHVDIVHSLKCFIFVWRTFVPHCICKCVFVWSVHVLCLLFDILPSVLCFKTHIIKSELGMQLTKTLTDNIQLWCFKNKCSESIWMMNIRWNGSNIDFLYRMNQTDTDNVVTDIG